MKKEAIVSALLLMSPASQLQAADLSQAAAIVKQQRQELVDLVFVSQKTDVENFYVQDAFGDYDIKSFEYHIRFTFLKADEWYEYNGEGVMEYEAVVEAVTPDGRVLPSDYGHHYVKRMDENTFKMFDCNSTSRCSDEYANIEFHIFNTPNGLLMKMKNSSEVPEMIVNISKEFFQVK